LGNALQFPEPRLLLLGLGTSPLRRSGTSVVAVAARVKWITAMRYKKWTPALFELTFVLWLQTRDHEGAHLLRPAGDEDGYRFGRRHGNKPLVWNGVECLRIGSRETDITVEMSSDRESWGEAFYTVSEEVIGNEAQSALSDSESAKAAFRRVHLLLLGTTFVH
jgi:hypothetical protein